MLVRAKHWVKLNGWHPTGTVFEIDETAYKTVSQSVDLIEEAPAQSQPVPSEQTESELTESEKSKPEPAEVPKKRGRKKAN